MLDNRSDMLDISMEKVCSYLQLLSDDHINWKQTFPVITSAWMIA